MSSDWEALLDLLGYAGELKRLARSGWQHIGVPEPESVADHSYRVALLTLLLAQGDPRIDLTRVLILALVHDLPESIAGDLTPFDQALTDEAVDREALFRSRPAYSEEAERAKHAAEAAALRRLTGGLSEPLGRLIQDAWEEYEADVTPEARLVHQLDKLEALLQAFEYRETHPGLPIASFEIGTVDAVANPRLRRLLEAMVQRFGTAAAGRESEEPWEDREA